MLDSENPGWLIWANENTDLDFDHTILDEADGLDSDHPVDWWNVK